MNNGLRNVEQSGKVPHTSNLCLQKKDNRRERSAFEKIACENFSKFMRLFLKFRKSYESQAEYLKIDPHKTYSKP